MENITIKPEDLKKLIKDVAQIKEILITKEKELKEIELTDWAKNELEEARNRKTKVSHEEAKKIILSK